MKLGDHVFYDIEGSRQDYNMAMEGVPYIGAFVGFWIFLLFAKFSPISSNLYKETLISGILGCSLATFYPAYQKTIYMNKVSVAYDRLKAKFEKYPHLDQPDPENVMKNFGPSRWNNEEIEDIEDLEESKTSVFAGNID